jgi:HSP20 family protein
MAQYSLYRPWAAAPWGGPLDQLRQEMDAVLNRFGTGTAPSSSWRGVFPAVNLYEAADAYVLMAELPGLENEDIQVSLERSTVTIEGERKIDYANQEGVSLHRRERQVGSFRRAFELPALIDADKVEAVHQNGILMLRLPKSPEDQPRQISVQAS